MRHLWKIWPLGGLRRSSSSPAVVPFLTIGVPFFTTLSQLLAFASYFPLGVLASGYAHAALVQFPDGLFIVLPGVCLLSIAHGKLPLLCPIIVLQVHVVSAALRPAVPQFLLLLFCLAPCSSYSAPIAVFTRILDLLCALASDS